MHRRQGLSALTAGRGPYLERVALIGNSTVRAAALGEGIGSQYGPATGGADEADVSRYLRQLSVLRPPANISPWP